ncbi:SDR family oxidoreductase [Flavilitoribacter nigricans]|uniref:Short-chain dehydrogenase n=1 Tax=Flavilitoribacter nigricans (strain ATCC 23147 / DSM 23189 / NBRC 102662 / NCIMB 1420 / SS-2) TaxID=1122177 RepID=A0A2D0N6K2_FLAN2|nr:SDR family oxidoreductase [Flavilitoribacter nigricans]PHN04018.1 short-chain dehydrogenase [Flavilitoribacter nigricans DSM 23189 = NBRC 102662]
MTDPKIALVTGANRGIGLEVCRQLLAQQYRVILTSRDVEKGQEALDKLKAGATAGDLHFIPLDISNPDSVRQAAETVATRFGRLDTLVNNAAINYDTWQKATEPDLEECRQTLDVNLFGAWRMVQEFLPLLRKSDSGRIVNVSSGSGALQGMSGGTPAYSISKAALNVLTIKLAAETKDDDILVNSVCPGWVRTEMGGSNATRSIPEGARGIVWAATLPDDGPSGGFFRDGKRIDW